MVYNDEPRPSDHRLLTQSVYDNIYFDDETVSFPVTGTAAVTYELYDYYGELIDDGPVVGTGPLNFGILPLGFYTLYLPRVTPIAAPWLDSGGETFFCVIRRTSPLHGRPALGTPGAQGDTYGQGFDIPARGMCGVGPVRNQIRLDNTHYASDLAGVLSDIPYELLHRNTDAARPLRQWVAFPDFDDVSEQITNLSNAIPQLVAAGITYFEGKNEPAAEINQPDGENLVRFTTFANTVHAAHPSAKAMGPCPIDISGDWWAGGGGQAHWMYELLKRLDPPSLVDVISFHNYSNGQGDLAEMRHALDNMEQMLVTLGMQSKPRFNTEWGSVFATSNGVLDHHQQAKLIMLDLHLLEQYKTPKEHTYYFYDRSHGFWGFPSWWLHSEGEVLPSALVPIFRVWGEELFGKVFSERLNFGDADNLFLGSRFSAFNGSSVLALQSSGVNDNVTLAVTGASQLTVVDSFGNESSLPVTNGRLTILVDDIPSYVRVPSGVTVTVVPADWGVEVFRAQGSVASALDGSATAKLALDNSLWWSGGSKWVGTALPNWLRVDFPAPTRFNRVTFFGSNPVNERCVPVDFDVQVLQGGSWNTVATYLDPRKQRQWTSYKQAGATFITTWWRRQNQWSFRLPQAVLGDAVRIYIRATSFGGAPTVQAYNQNPATNMQIGLSDVARPEIREMMCHLNEYDLGKVPGVPLLIQ